MKYNPTLIALFSLAILLPATADTFTLNDGSTVEGTIIKEDADSYLIEVQVTSSIKDERKVAKADVAKVARERPDEKAFEKIEKFVPTPDLLTDAGYGERISAVEKFIKDFPSSKHLDKAKAMLATLKSEAPLVASGGVKINGGIISPENYQQNTFYLDARVEEAKINLLVAERQYLAALRAFSDFSTNFKGTTSLAALTPVMQRLMANQVAEAKQLLATFDDRVKKRDIGLERMAADDRRITENAIKEEDKAIEARFKAEKAAHIIWVVPSPFNKSTLDEIVRSGEAEIKRLETSSTVLGNDSGKLWREAMSLIKNGGSANDISAAIAAARDAGVSAKYMTMLEEAAKANSKK